MRAVLLVVGLGLGVFALVGACGDDRPKPTPDVVGSYDGHGRPARGVVPKATPSVVLVVLEGVRADDFGRSMPRLSARAARGVRFPGATAPASRGLLSLASMLTGVDPGAHQVQAGELVALVPTMPEVLAAVGYRTAAWVGPSVASRRRGLDQGFGSYVGTASLGAASDAVGAWLEKDAKKPAFLLLHEKPSTKRAEAAQALALADATIDTLLGRIERALPTPPVVLLTSTHGVARGEHGTVGSGGGLHEEHLRVPLAVWGPGVPTGERRGAWGPIDVAATVLSMLSLPALRGDGRPLLDPTPPDEARVVEAQEYALLPTARGLVNHFFWSARTTRAKYVARIDVGTGEGEEHVFDLAADPGERKPLPVADLERFGEGFAKRVQAIRDSIQRDRKAKDDLVGHGYAALPGPAYQPPEDPDA